MTKPGGQRGKRGPAGPRGPTGRAPAAGPKLLVDIKTLLDEEMMKLRKQSEVQIHRTAQIQVQLDQIHSLVKRLIEELETRGGAV